jgi:hypothetical protein
MHDKSHPFWCPHSWVKCIKATFFRALLSDGPKKAILCSKRDHWCLLSDWGVNALGWHTSRRQSSNFYNAEWSVTLHCTLLNCWWKLDGGLRSGRTNERSRRWWQPNPRVSPELHLQCKFLVPHSTRDTFVQNGGKHPPETDERPARHARVDRVVKALWSKNYICMD